MLVKTPDGDILEMNVIEDRGGRGYSVSVRRGGHIQPICGTSCMTIGMADVLLCDLSDDLKSGKWVLGTKDARPIVKRADSFQRATATNWGSEY
jgi:hypothetical protein|tara:strand:- start:1244 stop:1525 length:282 start_codon:yes stop_codon:yes gene_type:complete